MKKYNSIDGRIHTNSRLWFVIRMAVRKMICIINEHDKG